MVLTMEGFWVASMAEPWDRSAVALSAEPSEAGSALTMACLQVASMVVLKDRPLAASMAGLWDRPPVAS